MNAGNELVNGKRKRYEPEDEYVLAIENNRKTNAPEWDMLSNHRTRPLKHLRVRSLEKSEYGKAYRRICMKTKDVRKRGKIFRETKRY